MMATLIQYPLDEKVDFLSRPTAYPERTMQVVTKETHMSWVFLTDQYAYKLKKPVHYPFLDYSSLEARSRSCQEELRLNRRLAESVYLSVVPLVINAAAELQLEGEGQAVDWLVKMQRLSDENMLDSAIRYHIVTQDLLQPVVQHLVTFYQSQAPVPIILEQYVARLEAQIVSQFQELATFSLPGPLNPEIMARQQQFLSEHTLLFRSRIQQGRIRELHGDLRPEHICLNPPVIIDCLEFKPELRILDMASELAFLSLECAVSDASWIATVFWDTYRQAIGDQPPEPLKAFYQSVWAVLRALLAMRHLLEEPYRDKHQYLLQAQSYIRQAEQCMSMF